MVSAVILFVQLALGCEKAVTVFTEYSVARTIEHLGGRNGQVFSAIIRGYSYEAIKKHFGLNDQELKIIREKGTDYIWDLKQRGL